MALRLPRVLGRQRVSGKAELPGCFWDDERGCSPVFLGPLPAELPRMDHFFPRLWEDVGSVGMSSRAARNSCFSRLVAWGPKLALAARAWAGGRYSMGWALSLGGSVVLW